ncbi:MULTISPECIES: transglutaminaseTgpA domain-containing protein [unclassified Microbacterium]|uniref:transglutaminase family protein n=1 Tax=unclassified Microbacterium TaxID=2609290 RepID=UPI00386ACCBC
MSADTPAAPRRRHDGFSTVALFVALAAALIPLLSVVATDLWVVLALALSGLILAAGYVARRRRVPAVVITLGAAALWLVFLTVVFFSDAAWLGIIPSGEAFDRIPLLVDEAAESIRVGVAPLVPTAAVSFLIVGAVGILVIALDHVVLTARMPLLAAVALMSVWLIPTLAVPRSVDVWGFALLAAAILILIRAETRSRALPRSAGRPAGGVGAVAGVIGVVAITASMLAAPALPQSVASGGFASGTRIDTSLNLGDDLRRPDAVPVVRSWSDAPTPPYLRVATLSGLRGESWRPDRGPGTPLDQWGGEAPAVAEDIEVAEYRTRVQVLDLVSSAVPVPYPATGITDLDDSWSVLSENLTVTSAASGAGGQEFDVVTSVPRPSLEQARAARTTAPGGDGDVTELPESMPSNIARLAEEVTADATNDYDRLVALQSWFRGADFEYSLDAPVAEGFDGSGADAVGDFLEVRAGYCVHFASAFALMARTLDMPSRIVVGFLPGAATADQVGGARVYEATTAQLHAWPEVHFEGIGWVAFEPTKSLGTPQRFVSDETPDDQPEPTATPTPTASPAPTETAAPQDDQDDTAAGATSTGPRWDRIAPVAGGVAGVVLVLAAPALLRLGRRHVLRGRARAGSVGAAWRMVQDAAIDLGIPVPASESARAFGARLVAQHGADDAATGRLVERVELASYAPSSLRAATGPGGMAPDADEVGRSMLAHTGAARRIIASTLPRSLVVRPGSTFAETAASTS